MGVEIPARYGGQGRGLTEVMLTIEEISRVDPGVAVIVDVQNALVASALLRHGTGEQRRRLLPRLATGTIGAYAISEEQAGSDAFAMTTTFRAEGGGYRLDGRKQWTTNAADAGLFLVFAKESGSGTLAAFVVDRDAPGVRIGEPVDKLGIRASSTCELILENVHIGQQDVLGAIGDGELLAVRTLCIGKVGIAAQLVGLARGALETAVDYAQRREQFGKRIFGFQGVQFPLAALAAELDAARTLLYEAVAVVESDQESHRALRVSSSAKYVASSVADRMASHAVETLGGKGVDKACRAEKLYRDVKVGKIYEGTSNMQFRTIAAALAAGEAR
jgi:butyryl-CoA dehydrogenase